MKLILTILLILTGISLRAQSDNEFSVRIFQNNLLVEIVNNEISLEKSEFDLVLEFSDSMGVLLNASFDKQTFKNAKINKAKSELPGFEGTGMADALFNPEKQLIVSKNAPNYLYYDSDEDHRFNKVERVHNQLVCTRTINNFFLSDTDSNQAIEQVNIPLYLVFISVKHSETLENEVEVQRAFIKINWK